MLFDDKSIAKAINQHKEWIFGSFNEEPENDLHVMFTAINRYNANDDFPSKPRIAFEVSFLGSQELFRGYIQWENLEIEHGEPSMYLDSSAALHGSTVAHVIQLMKSINKLSSMSFSEAKEKVGL